MGPLAQIAPGLAYADSTALDRSPGGSQDIGGRTRLVRPVIAGRTTSMKTYFLQKARWSENVE